MPHKYGYNFGHNPLPRYNDLTRELVESLHDLNEALAAREIAKAKVPDYTGQHSDLDYYADEEAWVIRAGNRFHEALRNAQLSGPAE